MTIPKEGLKFFAKFIESEIGIVYSEVNYYQLESRLEEIAKQINLPNAETLWEKAKNEGIRGTLKLLLIDTATNNETSFFRDPNVFRALAAIATETLTNAPTAEPYRVWSTACSTGQEIYSLAILFAEMNAARAFNYSILATDISERVLTRAQQGYYSQLEVQRGLTPAQLARYFTQETAEDPGQVWRVKDELKRGLDFRKLNLLEPWQGLAAFNLILCRNVLIYQTVENKKKVVTKLYEHLTPGGYLILGGAESLIGIFEEFEYKTYENVVVYRRPDVTLAKADSA